jgi:hypothetical protein
MITIFILGKKIFDSFPSKVHFEKGMKSCTLLQQAIGRIFLISIFSSLLTVSLATRAQSPKGPWLNRLPLLEKKFSEALANYSKNDIRQTKRLWDDAYFGIFEQTGANMEVAIRTHLSAQLSSAIEEDFGEVRKSFIKNLPITEITKNIDRLKIQIEGAAKELDNNKVKLQ